MGRLAEALMLTVSCCRVGTTIFGERPPRKHDVKGGASEQMA